MLLDIEHKIQPTDKQKRIYESFALICLLKKKKAFLLFRFENKMVSLPRPALIYSFKTFLCHGFFCRKKFHNLQLESKWGGRAGGDEKGRGVVARQVRGEYVLDCSLSYCLITRLSKYNERATHG